MSRWLLIMAENEAGFPDAASLHSGYITKDFYPD
jgi:hypothetical protein